MARYVNIAIHLVSAIHLSFSAYMHHQNYIPPSAYPIDSAFSGKLKYLTFWNVCIEAVFFSVALVDDILQEISGHGKSSLKGFIDYAYTTIVFPTSMMVTTTFWSLFLLDRELIMPKVFDQYFPLWLNHSVHTSVAVYAILEMLTAYHPLSPLCKSLTGLYIFSAAYISWLHVVYIVTGMWVYPILGQLNGTYRIAFLLSNFAVITMYLYGGRYVNTIVWKQSIRDSKKKRN